MRTVELVKEVGHELRKPVIRAIEAFEIPVSLDEVLDAGTLWQLLGTIDYVLEFIRVVTQGPAFDTEEVTVPVHVALGRVKKAHPQIAVQENLASARGYMDGRLIARLTEVLLEQVIEAQSSESCEIFVTTSVDSTRNEIIVSIGDQELAPNSDHSDTASLSLIHI